MSAITQFTTEQYYFNNHNFIIAHTKVVDVVQQWHLCQYIMFQNLYGLLYFANTM